MNSLLTISLIILASWASPAAAQHADKSPAQLRYEKEAFFWGQGLVITTQGSAIIGARNYQTVHKGKYGPPLSPAEFYNAVGEHELASDYRLHTALKWGIGAGVGGGLLIGGMALVLVNLNLFDFDSDPSHVREVDNTAALVGGGVMIGLGLIGIMTAVWLNVDSRTMSQKREMGDNYNSRLRRELSRPPASDIVDLRISPTFSVGGGGLALSGRF